MDGLETVKFLSVEHRDRFFKDAVLPEIRSGPAEVLSVLPELGVALDPGILADEPDAAVVLEDLQHRLAGGLLLEIHLDRVHVHKRRRNDHREGDDVYVREDGQDVRAVVARDGGRVEDDRIDWSPLDVAGVGSTPDHHRSDPLDAEGLIQGMDDADEPGGVA